MRAVLYSALLTLGLASLPAQVDADAALDKAQRWLLANVDRGDWLDGVESNTLGKRLVAQSVLAWLMVARAGDDGGLRAAADRLAGRCDDALSRAGMTTMAFSTWLTSSAAFCLAERWRRDGVAPAATARLVERLSGLRNSEGVWAHGSMEGLIAFYPSTLVAASNWALFALGVARSAGVEVRDDVLAPALALLSDVQAANGGMPYGGRPYRLGVEAGRTAGTVMALAGLGEQGGATFAAAAGYVRANLRLVPAGHASPAMHVFNGALCAWLLGPACWDEYQRLLLDRFVAAQRDDGTFEDVMGERSPDSMAVMGDELTNRAYVTALYAAALAVPGSRLGAWLRERVASALAVDGGTDVTPSVTRLPVRWRAQVEGAVGLGRDGDHAVVLRRDGWEKLGIDDGRARATQRNGWAIEGETLFVRDGLVVAVDATTGAIVVGDLATGQRRWGRRMAISPSTGIGWRGEQMLMQLSGGTLVGVHLHDGDEHSFAEVPADGMRHLLCPLPDGACIVTADAAVACYEANGGRRWHGRNRDPIARIPASWMSIAVAGDTFVGGSSDGAVIARRLDDGSAQWRAAIGCAAVQVLVDAAAPERVFVLDAGGVLRRIRAGKIVWQVDVGGGRQDPDGHPSRAVLDGERIWVAATGRGLLLEIDLDGCVRGTAAFADDDDWLVVPAGVLRRSGDEVWCIARSG